VRVLYLPPYSWDYIAIQFRRSIELRSWVQRPISSQSAFDLEGLGPQKRCEIKKGMIEIVTCRCCGREQERVYEGNVSGPGCKCSGFWCVISAKCVAHCPGLHVADHACSSSANAGSYARTFLFDYRTVV
jgi:hypothetical protein